MQMVKTFTFGKMIVILMNMFQLLVLVVLLEEHSIKFQLVSMVIELILVELVLIEELVAVAGGGIFDRTYGHGGSGSSGTSYGGGCGGGGTRTTSQHVYGGSVNIFYSVYLEKGNITAYGGSAGMVSGVGQLGGAGGPGCISYGSIASGSYVAGP